MTRRPFSLKKAIGCPVNKSARNLWLLLMPAAALFLTMLILWALYSSVPEEEPAEENELILFSLDTEWFEAVDEIPNTCEKCVLERKSLAPGRLYLVILNDGQLHSLEIEEMYESDKDSFGYVSIQPGRDEFSDMRLTVISDPDQKELNASISPGTGGVSILRAKSHFCDDCLKKMLTAAEGAAMVNAVLLDDETGACYGISPGEQLKVGKCAVTISQQRQKENITIHVEYDYE